MAGTSSQLTGADHSSTALQEKTLFQKIHLPHFEASHLTDLI